MSSRITRDILQGDLSDRNLPEILQFLQSLQREGQLLIEEDVGQDGRAPKSAGIYFSGGQVVHATCPPYDGIDAFYAILGLKRGRFVFVGGQEAPVTSISIDFHALLLEGIRRQDEWQRLVASLPDFSEVLYPSYDRELLERRPMGWREWRLFEMVDGRRRLTDIIELGGPDPVANLEGVAHLFKVGLLSGEPQVDFLDQIILRRLGPESREGLAIDPPGSLGRHLVRHCDGQAHLRMIGDQLGAGEHALVVAARHLLRNRWVAAVHGRAAVFRYLV